MSGLEALARIIPTTGRGLTREEIDLRLDQLGTSLGEVRLAGLLYYLEQYQMVTRDGDRYLQVRKVAL